MFTNFSERRVFFGVWSPVHQLLLIYVLGVSLGHSCWSIHSLLIKTLSPSAFVRTTYVRHPLNHRSGFPHVSHNTHWDDEFQIPLIFSFLFFCKKNLALIDAWIWDAISWNLYNPVHIHLLVWFAALMHLQRPYPIQMQITQPGTKNVWVPSPYSFLEFEVSRWDQKNRAMETDTNKMWVIQFCPGLHS